MTDKTITPEQFEANVKAAFANVKGVEYPTREAANRALYIALLAESGITLAPPPPSPEMVRLAEQIAYDAGDNLMPRDYTIAALQYVEKLVKDAPSFVGAAGVGDYISRTTILTAIGSNAQ